MEKELEKIFNIIMKDIKKAIQLLLINLGIDEKSNVVKTIEVLNTDKNGLSVYVQDYLKFIISGRKKFARKIPLAVIIRIIKRSKGTQGITRKKGISINKLAFMIQESIYRNGIKGIGKGKRNNLYEAIEDLTQKVITQDIERLFKIEANKKSGGYTIELK